MDLDYKIWANYGKNRLYLVIKGPISDEAAKAAAEKTMEEAKKLQSGFTVVSDVSQARPTGNRGAIEIKRAQAFLGYLGVKRIIQVIPQSDDKTAKQQGYPAANMVFSIDEADIILDRLA